MKIKLILVIVLWVSPQHDENKLKKFCCAGNKPSARYKKLNIFVVLRATPQHNEIVCCVESNPSAQWNIFFFFSVAEILPLLFFFYQMLFCRNPNHGISATFLPCLDVSSIPAGENTIPYFPLVLTFVEILHLSYYVTYVVQKQSYDQHNYNYLDICRGPALVI